MCGARLTLAPGPCARATVCAATMAVDTTEDHVSMASVAGRKALEVIENTAHVLAIELICACQALDLHAPLEASPDISAVHAMVRETVPFLAEDRPLYREITALAARLSAGDLDAFLEDQHISLD